jgi:hypothetical protein
MLDYAQLLRNYTLDYRTQTIYFRGFIREKKPPNSLALQPFLNVNILNSLELSS